MNWSNRLSRVFGAFASYPFPRRLQILINEFYVKLFGISMEEFDTIDSYPTLSALFTRSLIKDRPLDREKGVLVAPCDSVVMALGDSVDQKALQIKGMEYPLGELLGEDLDEELSYLNLYLSPSDYHRFHAPCDLEVVESRYFSGELLSVNLASLKKHSRLFVRNERVVLKCRDAWGDWLYYVAIGAFNVGQMAIHFESRIKTNAKLGDARYVYERPLRLKKGQEIGLFRMGSTVVMVGKNWNLTLKEGERVRYAQNIGIKERE